MARKAAKKTARKSTARKSPARKTATRGTATTATARKTARKAAKRSTAKRSTAKRERLDTGSDVRYAKRAASGQWTEMDDAGRSQRVDRRRSAKKTVAPGYGDQGDQKRSTGRAAKKR